MLDQAAQPTAPELSRRISLDDTAAFRGQFEATPDERVLLSARFGVSSLASFSCRYSIEPLPLQRYRLTGVLSADMTQECVATLEPINSHIEEAFSVEFWPQAQIEPGAPELEPDLDDDPPEAIVDGRIDVGAFAAEILASAIDPYPRKAAAEFRWQEAGNTGGDTPSGPFAQLAKLKR